MLAAYLHGQFEMREEIQSRREDIWHTYHTQLADWARIHDVTLPTVPETADQAYHMYYMLLPSLEVRTRLIDFLKERGILSVFHYLPLHLSDMGRQFGGKEGDCPVTEDISDRLLRLPFYYELSDGEQADVIRALQEFDAW
jgi:dTDP-4-amino-4,6-dideoxygalactose transaminase